MRRDLRPSRSPLKAEAANWPLKGCLPLAEVFGLACMECINFLYKSTFKSQDSSPKINQTFFCFTLKSGKFGNNGPAMALGSSSLEEAPLELSLPQSSPLPITPVLKAGVSCHLFLCLFLSICPFLPLSCFSSHLPSFCPFLSLPPPSPLSFFLSFPLFPSFLPSFQLLSFL